MSKNVAIIGSGIGGLATASILAKQGCKVTVYEKNEQVGGRASQFSEQGFTFDMGPSWYLMPEVFENFFAIFNKKPSDYYKLKKLSPAYKVFFDYRKPLQITTNISKDKKTFESIEVGSGDKLVEYIASSEFAYKTAVSEFLYNPFIKYSSLLSKTVLKNTPFLLQQVRLSLDSFVSKSFDSLELKQVLEYATVFLGASPYNAPALYHLMSYLDFKQGVYYPEGGFYAVPKALKSLAIENGVSIKLNANISKINTKDGQAHSITVNGQKIEHDIVISNADLEFTETKLLKPEDRTYSENYFKKRTLAPSSLLMYLGVKGKLKNLEHHNLLFVKAWKENFTAIFKDKSWPEKPSIYVSKTSATDTHVAPKGHENIFVLVPLPSHTDYSKNQLTQYADRCLDMIAEHCQQPDLKEHIVYRKDFGPKDFKARYNSFNGTALGLAHTLKQSAFFRPSSKSKKVSNLFYVGGNVQPGIGVPMCLISAELAYKHIANIASTKPLKDIL